MKSFNVILFNGFETLDAFGPVEVIGKLASFYQIKFYSLNGGTVKSVQNVSVGTKAMAGITKPDIILIPGGMETRTEVDNQLLIDRLRELAVNAEYVLTVCTGTALLARTGLLKGHKATSNKMAFDWVTRQDPEVEWIRRARWVHDGKYYSSSGVSAGMDMTLGFIKDRCGKEAAQKIARGIEYIWNEDSENDPFC